MAIRFRIRANLAGRRFEDVVVDVGTGESLVAPPDIISGPDILAFADLLPVSISVIAIEQHIAEKVHAYTRVYPHGRQSTRAKDLVDLVLIQSLCEVNAKLLLEAIRLTYGRYSLQPFPSTLPPPPENWHTMYPALAVEVSIDPDLQGGYVIAAAFLDPVLSGLVGADAVWDPQRGEWLAEDQPTGDDGGDYGGQSDA